MQSGYVCIHPLQTKEAHQLRNDEVLNPPFSTTMCGRSTVKKHTVKKQRLREPIFQGPVGYWIRFGPHGDTVPCPGITYNDRCHHVYHRKLIRINRPQLQLNYPHRSSPTRLQNLLQILPTLLIRRLMVLQLLLQIGDFRSRLAALARKALVHRIDRNIDEPGTGGQPSATDSKSGRGWNFRVRVRVAGWVFRW